MERIPVIEHHIEHKNASVFASDKIHVRMFPGVYSQLRRMVSWPLLFAYFALVWGQSDGQPWILFSIDDRRLFFFGSQLGWNDLSLLAGILIVAAFGLFVVALTFGRIWCGFACPQSVWTWLFLRVENALEGPAWRRKKQASTAWASPQYFRCIGKHVTWGAIALITAITFTGYFVPIRDVLSGVVSGNSDLGVWSWVMIMAGLTYLNAGLVREKICLHACPYSRFQSVMFDDDTRTVSYDALRGEPKGSGHSTQSGDCVDCTLCVQVCPTGIDIREGLQAACIDCGACIDACDSVMTQLNREKGLIGFYSQHTLSTPLNKRAGAQLHNAIAPLFRWRAMAYLTIFIVSIIALNLAVIGRDQLHIGIERDRTNLFTQLPNGQICNTYTVELESFYPKPLKLRVSLRTPENSNGFILEGPEGIHLPDGKVVTKNYRVCTDSARQRRTEVAFVFSAEGIELAKTSTFLAGSVR